MRVNSKPAVVIPVYKTELNRYESISLQRHLSILRRYDRFILAPYSLRQAIQTQLLPNLLMRTIFKYGRRSMVD